MTPPPEHKDVTIRFDYGFYKQILAEAGRDERSLAAQIRLYVRRCMWADASTGRREGSTDDG